MIVLVLVCLQSICSDLWLLPMVRSATEPSRLRWNWTPKHYQSPHHGLSSDQSSSQQLWHLHPYQGCHRIRLTARCVGHCSEVDKFTTSCYVEVEMQRHVFCIWNISWNVSFFTVQENKTFVPPLILLMAQWWGKQQW